MAKHHSEPQSSDQAVDGRSPNMQASMAVPGAIDQVREILFGVQMQTYEQRFQSLEVRVTEEAARIRTELKEGLHELAKSVEVQGKDLNRQLDEERQERGRSVDDLTARVQSEADSARSHTETQSADAAGDRAQIRNELQTKARDIEQALSDRFEELQRMLREAVADLNHRKTDRKALAALLTETANQLQRD